MMRSHSKLEHVGRVYVAAAAAAVASRRSFCACKRKKPDETRTFTALLDVLP